MAVSRLKVPSNPTIRDAVKAIHETHDCLNTVGNSVEVHGVHIQQIAGAMGLKLLTAQEIMDGVSPEKARHRLGNIRPSHALWMLGGTLLAGIPGGIAAYKVVEPAVVAFAAALHHALMTAH